MSGPVRIALLAVALSVLVAYFYHPVTPVTPPGRELPGGGTWDAPHPTIAPTANCLNEAQVRQISTTAAGMAPVGASEQDKFARAQAAVRAACAMMEGANR
jgi:hypothetical protein